MISNSEKEPFSVAVIKALKNKGFISSGIMLPIWVGACKIKDNYANDVDCKYLKEVFRYLLSELSESDNCLYFKKCEASGNFVLETDVRPLWSYKLHIYFKGKPVLYCKDSDEDSIIDDPDEAINYLIDKYISVLGKYCNFIGHAEYPHMRQLDIKEYLKPEYISQQNEIDIIETVLVNGHYGNK